MHVQCFFSLLQPGVRDFMHVQCFFSPAHRGTSDERIPGPKLNVAAQPMLGCFFLQKERRTTAEI